VYTLDVKDLTRLAVGDPETADITLADKTEKKGTTGVHITGLERGETTLVVWTKEGALKAYKLVIQG
jgi:Flp pilus assembly secretin CpaC